MLRLRIVVPLLVVVAVVVASQVQLSEYAVQPGTAESVQQFITVPADKAHPVARPVQLTDVQIARVTALNYLYFWFQGDTDLVPLESVTGGTPPSEFNAQGELEMDQAEDAAKAASLTRLGYTVTSQAGGAVIFGVWEGTPAWGVLQVGDVVTAVDGTPTPTAQALTEQLQQKSSGDTVTLSVKRKGTEKAVPVSVRLQTTEVDIGGGKKAKVNLGIEPEDQVDFTYPFPVTIDVANIGGPSAGLAMTLGVIDTLSGGKLTGSHKVAATGTMDAQGNVGDVGGVPQKTVAVERSGATIFLVPPQEYKAAKSKQTPGLKIYAVSTLDQALAVLAAHGGHVPPLPSTSVPAAGSPALAG